MRAVLAVVVGYLIFAGSAVLLFHVTKVDPHSPATVSFEIFTIAYGVAFSLLAGFVTGKIARRTDLVCGIALALVIAVGATISMIARPGAGALWNQTAALLVLAPASLAGDWTRRRTSGRVRK
jgi:peptidoglycan/LPS O-acetylase OafA/YrhL